MQQFAAFIMDITGSRQYATEERNRLQDRLVRCSQILNDAFASLQAKAVDFSGGDEVQGLFFDVFGAYLYYRLLEIFMLPYPTRSGIGTGVWDTRVTAKGTAAQDGPAYHTAREAIETAHRLKTQSVCLVTRDAADIGLNLLTNASVTLKSGLSPAQLGILRRMEIRYPFDYAGMIRVGELTRLETDLPAANGHEAFPQEEIELERPVRTLPEERILRRNMVSQLARYDQTSVQNTSNLIQRGNLLSIRSMDYYVACRLLERKDA